MKFICLVASILLISPCLAQQYPKQEIDLSRLAEELIGFQDEDTNYEELYENLVQLLANPIDINIASSEDLKSIYILKDNQIQELIKYRNEHGKLLSIYELQVIPELDLGTIYKLLPFIKITDPKSVMNRSIIQRVLEEKNNYLLTRYERTLETKQGFQQSDSSKKFQGPQDKFYMRFRTSRSGDFSFGFTAENDPGEKFKLANHQYGPDYLSYHAQVLNKGKIKNLIVGDFQSQFGQGLILGGAFGLGKGGETITTTRKSNIGFVPYTSGNESGFYRGACATFQFHKNIFVSGFYSNTKRDGSIQNTSDDNNAISSFLFTGLHRNEKEISKRKIITEINYGTILNYRKSNLDAGLIFHLIDFSLPIEKRPSPYNQFGFNGNQNRTLGAFINYTYNNFSFFSETAKSINGGVATITGLLSSLNKNFDMALLYRKFDKNYYSFYANAFSESTQPQNETGFYWGWKYTWNRKYNLAGYTDFFKFPWLGFRRYHPSQGYEWLLRFNYQPTRKILMYVQLREEEKDRNVANASNLYEITQGLKRNYWFAINYEINEHLKIKTRAQFTTYSLSGKTTRGQVLLLDISYSIGQLQFTGRHALFDTEDFDNRQYVYENDVWLAFSLPAYYGVGQRNFLLIEYKFNKKLSFWLRYSRSRFTDRTEIGSGLDTIIGNTRNDIKFQTLFRF